MFILLVILKGIIYLQEIDEERYLQQISNQRLYLRAICDQNLQHQVDVQPREDIDMWRWAHYENGRPYFDGYEDGIPYEYMYYQ